MRSALIIFVCFYTVVNAAVCGAAQLEPVKYVFLFIGDGMSIPQRMMAEEYLRSTGQPGLKINAMPQQAITTTRAADSFITDSAASGTAIACGTKTNNGAIGVDAAGKRLESVAEIAHKNGRKVGMITSVTINHATPAAFYGHRASREQGYDLGLDLIASDFEYFGGGGVSGHKPKHAENVQSPPQKDIYVLAAEAGYTVARGEDAIRKLKAGQDKKVLAVGSETDLPYAIDVPEGGLRLADYTRQAIGLLDNPKGFFIMTEGGKIDWMCHANDAATTLHEIIEFDNAVKVAFEFAEKHPDDTLIVVTGDHETGGLTLGFAGTGYASYIQLIGSQKASLNTLNRYFDENKYPDVTFENVKQYITEKTGLQFTGQKKQGNLVLTDKEIGELQNAFHAKHNIGKMLVRILNNKASLGWTSSAHTALPVSTTAWGKGADAFSGMMDNTDIAKKLTFTVHAEHSTAVQPAR